MKTFADIEMGQQFLYHGKVHTRTIANENRFHPNWIVTPVFEPEEDNTPIIDPNEGRLYTARGPVRSRPKDELERSIEIKRRLKMTGGEMVQTTIIIILAVVMFSPFLFGG